MTYKIFEPLQDLKIYENFNFISQFYKVIKKVNLFLTCFLADLIMIY